MSVNKVKLSTGETLIDLTGDSVAPETLAKGETAHDASGKPIVGTMPVPTTIETWVLEMKDGTSDEMRVGIYG